MPDSFKAYRAHDRDGRVESIIEALTLDDLSPGDVVIHSAYSCINYKDALAMTGKSRIMRRFPLVGGIDVSGVVESSSDERFASGDRVLVTGCGMSEDHDGGYAEYVRAPGDWVVPVPDELSLWDAMAIGTAGFTAALAVHRMQVNGQSPDLGPIVVTGATGGVGSMAIQMLSGLGFEVTALTGKSDAAGYLEDLGASRVLSRDELEMKGRPLDRAVWGGAVDNLGGEVLAWIASTVVPNGNIASIGLAASHRLETTVMPFILRGVNLLGINSVFLDRDLRLELWRRCATELRPSKLDRIASRTIPLHALPEAFGAYIDGRNSGRTVVEIRASES